MDKTQQQIDEFFNTAEAVQVEDGTWYYHESSVESELVRIYKEVQQLRAENEALYEDNKSLRDYIASLMSTMPKIKADAVNNAAQLVMYEYEGEARNRDIAEYLEDYADKLERGE